MTRWAEGIYREWAFDRMPVLADSLEEAGCDRAEVLGHCRGEGMLSARIGAEEWVGGCRRF